MTTSPRSFPSLRHQDKQDTKSKIRQYSLLIVTDGQLKMTGNDTVLLVVTGGVASEFENFSGKIFEDGGEVN
jgi:hypothetical protein